MQGALIWEFGTERRGTRADADLTVIGDIALLGAGARVLGASDDGFLALGARVADPCGTTNSCNVTVTDSLGSPLTVTVPPAKY